MEKNLTVKKEDLFTHTSLSNQSDNISLSHIQGQESYDDIYLNHKAVQPVKPTEGNKFSIKPVKLKSKPFANSAL